MQITVEIYWAISRHFHFDYLFHKSKRQLLQERLVYKVNNLVQLLIFTLYLKHRRIMNNLHLQLLSNKTNFTICCISLMYLCVLRPDFSFTFRPNKNSWSTSGCTGHQWDHGPVEVSDRVRWEPAGLLWGGLEEGWRGAPTFLWGKFQVSGFGLKVFSMGFSCVC